MDLYLSSGYNPDDFSITYISGVDVDIIDTNALNINLEDKTINGTITLKQRLDFENPIDADPGTANPIDPTVENSRDNDYEVAIFQVLSDFSINYFKLIVRITNLIGEPKKLEVLVDSHHLDDIDRPRSLREIYLYEDSEAMAPLMGSDSNNFLTTDLVEDTSFLGEVDASTDLTKLYDQDDGVDAFFTATPVNNRSNTYHRISLDFTEEVNIQQVAIRGRQVGGYYGFVFILRDKNDHIISVHQASNPLSKGSGSNVDATSTYAFIPDYENSRFPITNFGINLDNIYFDIVENTTNIILVDNFFVAPGYEYERGFVTIDPGADIDKFNTNDLYFLDNELVGLSFKTAPDAEDKQDADNNNIYELGTVTITNVDGGRLTFSLPVEVINVPTTVSLTSNTVSYTLSIYDSNVIADLTEVVNPSNFENALNLGQGTYIYGLAGTDAGHFRIVGNTVKTAKPFGFSNVFDNDGVYHFQVLYTVEGGVAANATLNVTVHLNHWQEINSSAPWSARRDFQTVVLANDELLLMGGYDGISKLNDIWQSDDGGKNWSQITSSASWSARNSFQALVIGNRIVVIGGATDSGVTYEVQISDNGGTNWNIPRYNPKAYERYYEAHAKREFQAVAFSDKSYLSIGGLGVPGRYSYGLPGYIISSIYYYHRVWYAQGSGPIAPTKNTQKGWVYASYHYFAEGRRRDFQAVVLNDNDVLIMGGFMIAGDSGLKQDIWMTSNKGASWSQISAMNHWPAREKFQAIAFPNDEILVMGGYLSNNVSTNDIWRSGDRGVNWSEINHTDRWQARRSFQAVNLGGTVVVMGGRTDADTLLNDVWALDVYNRHYFPD